METENQTSEATRKVVIIGGGFGGLYAAKALANQPVDVTLIDRGSTLISWSGSMFEYLMPLLVMHEPAGSLLEGTDRSVVRRQIEIGIDCVNDGELSKTNFTDYVRCPPCQ